MKTTGLMAAALLFSAVTFAQTHPQNQSGASASGQVKTSAEVKSKDTKVKADADARANVKTHKTSHKAKNKTDNHRGHEKPMRGGDKTLNQNGKNEHGVAVSTVAKSTTDVEHKGQIVSEVASSKSQSEAYANHETKAAIKANTEAAKDHAADVKANAKASAEATKAETKDIKAAAKANAESMKNGVKTDVKTHTGVRVNAPKVSTKIHTGLGVGIK